jgi:hypothetical protein
VVVVNETMARQSWRGESPVGRRINSSLSFAGRATREIVGVVGDVRQAAWRIGRSRRITFRFGRSRSDR